MDLVTVLAIAVGLSMDAFAVSVASGIAARRLNLRHALRVALFFGGFQALMPVAGWFAGSRVAGWIAAWDHWAAFALLAVIGGKMIYEAAKMEKAENPVDPRRISVLLVLSVATSLDALAVGFSFAFLHADILMPVIIIGLVTFVLSLVGMAVGERMGHFFEKKIELVGGLVLIAIGVKIVVEHLLR